MDHDDENALRMTSHDRIDILFLGCGAFAHRYHVPAIVADSTLAIAGIFDPNPGDATNALAQRYGAPLVARIDDLPRTAGLAFAIVTTPHTLHAGHVDALLDRGMHVLVDKPFVMRGADAVRLAQRAAGLARRQRRRLQPSLRRGLPARPRDPERGAASAKFASCRPYSSATSAPAGSCVRSSAAADPTPDARRTWPISCHG